MSESSYDDIIDETEYSYNEIKIIDENFYFIESIDILAFVLRKQEDINKMVKIHQKHGDLAIKIEFKKNYNQIDGMSIIFPADVYQNKGKKCPGIIETVLLRSPYNNIAYTYITYDKNCGYSSEKRFLSFDDLIDDIIRMCNYLEDYII